MKTESYTSTSLKIDTVHVQNKKFPAAIVSTYLEDISLISRINLSNVVQRRKIRRKEISTLFSKFLYLETDQFGTHFVGRRQSSYHRRHTVKSCIRGIHKINKGT